MMISHGMMVARIAAGAALGGTIGYERDRHGRPVGLRTHLIVALTAATFMVISSQFTYFQHFQEGEHIEVDASRIAASVVSAIGFLAAGAILRTGVTIQGLTTAAGLWLVTAIGMAAGAGMFVESAAVTGIGLFALTFLRRFEDKADNLVKRRVALVLGDDAPPVSELAAALTALGVRVTEVEYEHRTDEKRRTAVTFDLVVPTSLAPGALVDALERQPGVRRVHVSSAA